MCYGIQWGRYLRSGWRWPNVVNGQMVRMGTSFCFLFFLAAWYSECRARNGPSLIRMIHPDLWVFQGEHLQNWDPHWPPGPFTVDPTTIQVWWEAANLWTFSHQLSVEKLWIMSSTIVFYESLSCCFLGISWHISSYRDHLGSPTRCCTASPTALLKNMPHPKTGSHIASDPETQQVSMISQNLARHMKFTPGVQQCST